MEQDYTVISTRFAAAEAALNRGEMTPEIFDAVYCHWLAEDEALDGNVFADRAAMAELT